MEMLVFFAIARPLHIYLLLKYFFKDKTHVATINSYNCGFIFFQNTKTCLDLQL